MEMKTPTPILVEVREYSIYRSYWFDGRNVGVSIKTDEHRYANLFCDWVTFTLRADKLFPYFIDSSLVPDGNTDMCEADELEAVFYLVRNLEADNPNGYDLYNAIQQIQSFDHGYIWGEMLNVGWIKGVMDYSVIDATIALLRLRGTLNRAFDERYIVAIDPPLLTDDIDEAMLEALKIGKLPIDIMKEMA